MPRDRERVVGEVLRSVGLEPEMVRDRHPGEFSGGQCQRISIARALVLDPSVLICDEPVSALDVSVQAQILNLLEDMKARYGLTMLFIAHDLAVVKNVSDWVVVMYLGKICEVGEPDELYARPAHPYTQALLTAIPQTGSRPRRGGHRARRGTAVSDRSAVRLPVPDPVPAGTARLRRTGAADPRGARRALRGLPLRHGGLDVLTAKAADERATP